MSLNLIFYYITGRVISNSTKLSLVAQKDARRRAQCRSANGIGIAEGGILDC